ncbi:MAG TPA: histidine phosphatase family protein [Caldilineaceae bacterium]|nr:histidine phosphatase family protein [Caldilineaceae bacterium]
MATRIIYLIRHGQYHQIKDPSVTPDKPAVYGVDADEIQRDGGLTPAGVQQAEFTAQRLQALPIDCIYSSTLPRAMQTAAIIAQAIPGVTNTAHRDLWECIPHVPAKLAAWAKKYPAAALKQDQEQADAAFTRYFQPIAGDETADRHELLVCHGNLIRYFICRTLEVSLDAWINMYPHNCGVSIVQIQPDGDCKLIAFNDTGHLPTHLLTFNALATSQVPESQGRN